MNFLFVEKKTKIIVLSQKISYKDCDAIYVGQTKRKLNTRISEHRSQINRKSSNIIHHRT